MFQGDFHVFGAERSEMTVSRAIACLGAVANPGHVVRLFLLQCASHLSVDPCEAPVTIAVVCPFAISYPLSRMSKLLNAVVARIAALCPVVLRFVLRVGNPGDGFDVFQAEFNRSKQAQGRSVIDGKRPPVKMRC